MRRRPFKNAIYNLLLLLIVFACPVFSNANAHTSYSAFKQMGFNAITGITTEAFENGNRVYIHGNGKIPAFKTIVLPSPPRIVIDIPCISVPFTSRTIPVDISILKGIRLGYHSNCIRLVFDMLSSSVPGFTTMIQDRVLSMTLDRRLPTVHRSPDESVSGNSAIDDPILDNKGEMDIQPFLSERKNTVKPGNSPGPNEQSVRQKENFESNELSPRETVLDSLLSLNGDEPHYQEEGIAFKKAVQAYNTHNLSETIERLTDLLDKHPSGIFAEKAYFLLAEAYAQYYGDNLSEHFETIKARYEDAIYHFPESSYGPHAYYAIGDLCFSAGYYHEALGYFNLVIEKKKGTDIASKATMKKVDIYQMNKKGEEALSILQDLLKHYPNASVATEAKIEMSKILFEMNRFSQSMSFLNELIEAEPAILYRYSAISQYLGYNHYQLGNAERAKDYLFWSYNMDPEKEENHLVLTKIADIYRDRGLSGDAAKLYRLVVDRYPAKEGAFISLTRLAEQQEKGELKIKGMDIIANQFVEKTIDEPQKIYEEVMETLLEKDDKNPLIQLVMLRLALIRQKEKRYEESYGLLRNLLKTHPHTKVKPEVFQAMEKALEQIFARKMKKREYIGVVNMFHREKDMISKLESAPILLNIARAFDHLKLEDDAAKMYAEAECLLLDKDKPSDLLYSLSRNDIRQERFESALARLDLLIKQYPSDINSSRVAQLKGRIFLEQNAYGKAAEMLTKALCVPQPASDEIRIVLDKTKALIRLHSDSTALNSLKKATQLIRSVHKGTFDLSMEIGNSYLHLGHPRPAISVYTYALDNENEEDNRVQLQLALAKCYEMLNQPEDYIALYQQVSNLNDPFWSHLANERIAAHQFDGKMKKAQQ